MGPGNLVKVRAPSSGGAVVTIAYLVSEQDATRAVNIIKRTGTSAADPTRPGEADVSIGLTIGPPTARAPSSPRTGIG